MILNLVFGLLIGAWVGNFISFYTKELPKILIDENDERTSKDLWSEYLNFLSGGKCPECQHPYSRRRLIIELMTAFLYGGVLLKFSLTTETAVVLLACSLLLAAFITDFEHMLLPDQMTLPLLLLGLGASLVPIFATAKESLSGAIVGYGLFWLINVVFRYFRKCEGMYPGDFKLNAAIGAFVGPYWLFPIVFCSLLLLVVYAVIRYLMKARRIEMDFLQQESPYGSFSSLVTIFFLLALRW